MSSNTTENTTPRQRSFFDRLFRRRALGTGAVALALLIALGSAAEAGPIDSLLDIVRSIRNSVSSIAKRIPDQPKTRNLAKKFDAELLDGLADLVDQVRGDALQIVELVKREKAKLKTFEQSGGPARVKGYLDSMLLDFADVAERSQKLGCLIDPRRPQVPVDVSLMRDAVGYLPPIALYGMEAVLNSIDPQWPTLLASLGEIIPSDYAGELCGMEMSEFEQERCAVIEAIPAQDWSLVQLQIGQVASVMSIVKDFIPDDFEATLGAVAVGGAAAGTKVELPLKPILNAIEVSLGELNDVVDYATGVQEACFETGDRMERDLLTCTPLASYEQDFEAIQNLASRRLESIGDYQGAVAVEQTTDFLALCDTYQQYRTGR